MTAKEEEKRQMRLLLPSLLLCSTAAAPSAYADAQARPLSDQAGEEPIEGPRSGPSSPR